VPAEMYGCGRVTAVSNGGETLSIRLTGSRCNLR